MNPLIPVDISDQADAYARDLLEQFIRGDVADLCTAHLAGVGHTVSSLSVGFLDELRKVPGHPGDNEEYELIIMNMLLPLAYAIRERSSKILAELTTGDRDAEQF